MDRTDQTAIMESDAVDLNQLKHKIYQEAIRDIGQSGYEAHMRDLFGRPVLDFAKTLVMQIVLIVLIKAYAKMLWTMMIFSKHVRLY